MTTPDRIIDTSTIHIAYVYQAASEACASIGNSNLSNQAKHMWYRRMYDAIGVIVSGIKIEERGDGSIFLPSKPGKKRDSEEKKGHNIVGGKCSCLATEHGNICWARVAKRIVDLAIALDAVNNYDLPEYSNLFDEEEEANA